MKHLKKINEWKKNTPEDQKIDQENSDEIKDLFLDLTDLGCKLNIEIDSHLEESYNLNYYLVSTYLGFSVDTKNYEHSLETEIQKNKENLQRLNDYINLSHEFMMRLKNASYQIAYFNTEHAYVRGQDELVVKTTIRLSKK